MVLRGIFGGGDRRPILLETRSSTWFINAAVSTAIFTDVFLYSVIVPVFPFSLVNRNGIAEDQVQKWISILVAVYGAALLVGSPIFGFLADRIRYRRLPMLVGLLLLAGATLILCLAKSIALLVLGRALQGLSGSVVWVVGMALLSDTVGKDHVAQALGYIGTAVSLGTLCGPLLGGIVYQKGGYYAVFALCFGIILLDIIFRLTLIEKKAASKWIDVDPTPPTEQSTELSASNPSSSTDPEKQSQPTTTQSLVTTASNTTPSPSPSQSWTSKLPPLLTLMTSKRLIAATIATTTVSITMSGLDTTLTLFVARTFNWSSLAAGILFLAILLPTLFGPLFGYIVDKHGPRYIAFSGLLFMVAPFTLLRLVDHNSTSQKILLVALLFLAGLGIAMAFAGIVPEFSKVCDAREKARPGMFGDHGAYAQAYGLFNMAWAAGGLVGAFWAGGVYSSAGWGTMGWSLGLLCGVASLPVLAWTDGWIGGRGKGKEGGAEAK